MQQQVLAVPGGVDPLAEGLFETVVAERNVFGGASGTGRLDPPRERAERVMTKNALRRHGLCLLHRDAIEGRVTHDADLPVLKAEAGDQFGRRLGRQRRPGQEHKACGHSADCTTCHRPQNHCSPDRYPRPLFRRQCGRFKARAVFSFSWSIPGCSNETLEMDQRPPGEAKAMIIKSFYRKGVLRMKQISLKRAFLVAAAMTFGVCGSVGWSQDSGLSVAVDSAQARV